MIFFLNLEQLINLAILNWQNITKKDKVLQIIKNQTSILKKKQSKLKLGKIVFEVKELIFAEIPLTETLEIRYTRQDNTESDNLKLENRLDALKWKWDFYNIGAFLILSLAALAIFNYMLNSWMISNLPSFVLREEKFESLLEFTFYSLKNTSNLKNTPLHFKKINFELFDNIHKYVLNKGIIF